MGKTFSYLLKQKVFKPIILLEIPSVLVWNRRNYRLSFEIKTEGFSTKTFCFILKKINYKPNRKKYKVPSNPSLQTQEPVASSQIPWLDQDSQILDKKKMANKSFFDLFWILFRKNLYSFKSWIINSVTNWVITNSFIRMQTISSIFLGHLSTKLNI